MDLGQGISTSAYKNTLKKIHAATSAVFDILCRKTIEEEKEENAKNGRPLLTLKVSGDGSWKTRGFVIWYFNVNSKLHWQDNRPRCKGELLPIMYVLKKQTKY